MLKRSELPDGQALDEAVRYTEDAAKIRSSSTLPSVENVSGRERQTKSRAAADNSSQIKKSLLKAAMRLLSSIGPEGATSRAICAEVGVSAPTMYYHYVDLAALHRAAIDETYTGVIEAYMRGAKEKGPRQGLRYGWRAFNEFAYAEPQMCRYVIQQILQGKPPRTIASTLEMCANDLVEMHAKGLLKISPHEAVRILWMGTLGTVSYIASVRDDDEPLNPEVPNQMIEMTLDALLGPEAESEGGEADNA